jgi:hypothetical protein
MLTNTERRRFMLYGMLCGMLLVGAAPVPPEKRAGIYCPPRGDPAYDYVGEDGKRQHQSTTFNDAGDGDADGDGKNDLKGRSFTDEDGCEVTCWCLQKSAHHSQMIYCVKKCPNSQTAWFGGCFFGEGHNGLQFPGAERSRKPGGGCVYKKIGGVEQMNIDGHPPKGPPGGGDPPQPELHDYHFSISADGKTCSSVATRGSYKWSSERGGWWYDSHVVPGTEKTYPCPKEPAGVLPPPDNGPSTDSGPYQGGSIVVYHACDAGTWRYVLANDAGLPVTTYSGDEFFVAAAGVEEARVGWPASAPEYGAWRVDAIEDDGVSFRATTESPLIGEVRGFELYSRFPGGSTRGWNYSGGATSDAGPSWGPVAPVWARGDVTGDDLVNVTDAVALLSYLYQSGPTPPCLDAADVNYDGEVDLGDALRVVDFLFLGGEPPVPAPADC